MTRILCCDLLARSDPGFDAREMFVARQISIPSLYQVSGNGGVDGGLHP
uniref:Uncharacterized protein n=1 Tax=Zea mays TaxID=4577 RepID=B6UE77_MAIZE|nr:hypothetical protein [Zea mays]